MKSGLWDFIKLSFYTLHTTTLYSFYFLRLFSLSENIFGESVSLHSINGYMCDLDSYVNVSKVENYVLNSLP